MSSPTLSPEQLEQICGLVADYITTQRAYYFPQSTSLPERDREHLRGFFSSMLLQDARIVVLKNERVSNPAFYESLRKMGFENLPDFAHLAAVTFSDVIVSHEPFTQRLLFHELVHVEQYRQLGIPRFAELYVRGFLAGGGYHGIPLEVNAYTLDARFERLSL